MYSKKTGILFGVITSYKYVKTITTKDKYEEMFFYR